MFPGDLPAWIITLFPKRKIPELKAAGLLKDENDFRYGYYLSNERAARYKTIATVLDKILDHLDGCTLRPKRRRYSEIELSRFEVIEGNGIRPESFLFAMLKGSGIHE